MRRCWVRTYYYDRILQFYFNYSSKLFLSLSEAKSYFDKEYPIGGNIYSLDGYGMTRCKKITHKYVVYAEIEEY